MITSAENCGLLTARIEDFDISAERGFLPHPDPMTDIPRHNVMLTHLAELGQNLPKFLVAGTARKEIALFSKSLDEHWLKDGYVQKDIVHWSPRFTRRIKVTLDFLGQAFVWADYNHPIPVIPKGLASLWYEVSKHLDLPPIMEYCSYALWNWRRLDEKKPVQLGNIVLLQDFLGGLDEERFILVHVEIEANAGPIPQAEKEALRALTQENAAELEHQLGIIGDCLQRVYATMCRMTQNCDPYIYYHRVRPYIHGWKNNPALPGGVTYGGVGAYKNTKQEFRGESGMMSTIVPSLDATLNVIHPPSEFTPFLHEIPAYMPKGHREFLHTLQVFASHHSIYDYVSNLRISHPSLYESFVRARNLLADFSEKHYEYAVLYIFGQEQKHAGNPTATGTGGTVAPVSLKQHAQDRRMPILLSK